MAQKYPGVERKKLISIVTPFYNEGDAVHRFYIALATMMNALPGHRFEVVCIDDGSRDNTLEDLLEVADRDHRFHVIELTRNFGKEAAMTAGIEAARGDAVIPMDADLQDPPDLIPLMIEEWLRGAEVVLARRADRSADGLLKRVTARLFYAIHNRVSTVSIPANVGDFRLMDRAVVEALKALPERQRFMKGLFSWVGFKTVTLDYVRQERSAGTTKFSGWKLWNFALEGITSFSTAPLRIWTYLGLAGTVVTFAYSLFIILRTLIHGVDVPGYPSLLVAILLFGSLQLISVGLLGEYIGRIYLETKQRPTYLIRRHYRKRAEVRSSGRFGRVPATRYQPAVSETRQAAATEMR
jgi:glycosyltransferase involved in cell wall biosynthesis